MNLTRIWRSIGELRQMPRVAVDLMYAQTQDNDPYYARLVRQYYDDATRRHPRYWLIPSMVYGVALCQLPGSFDQYYMKIEASARRNHKKALREGCSFRRIQFNDHLQAIGEIRKSTDVRQGRLMPAEFREGIVNPSQDPPSLSTTHDYPHFGVFLGDTLIGNAACLIAGEFCLLDHILGHADHLPLGVVPQLIIGIAQHLYRSHPSVRYYAYGMYFGAGETMQRFKRKFGFVPHRVDWQLDRPAAVAVPQLAAIGKEG